MEIKKYEFPFIHYVCEGFITKRQAGILLNCVHDEPGKWVYYDNDCEKKRALNNFVTTPLVNMFKYLSCRIWLEKLQDIVKVPKLYPDPHLHGGGIHVTDTNGFLQRHVDYAIHPTLQMERRLNLILFLSNWRQEDGGELELYDNKELTKLIEPEPGRMVLWEPTECQGEKLRFHGTRENTGFDPRVTLANYYLSELRPGVPRRYEALFAPNRSKK